MKKYFIYLLILVLVSCGTKKDNGQDFPGIEQTAFEGICGCVTKAEIEEALESKLSEIPKEINEEYLGGRGCSFLGYEFEGEVHFGYIVFPSAEEFEKVRSAKKVDDVGDEAYVVNGPDAQQLWVKDGDYYVMIAIGDGARPKQSAKLAKQVLQRLKTKQFEL
ncbi:MAG: hypothetical protein JNK44_17065 [Cyclobacteriaceae bacterium]|nr:hypothetical protein [Cyclobacteriaceae bacterium]